MMENKKIKVMHFVSGLLSGGVEEMLYNYCKYMDDDKYDFVIVYQHEPVAVCKEKLESIGCKTVRITARSDFFLKNIKDSIGIIKKEKPDIVHAHMNLMNFCALYAAKKSGVKVRISHSHIAEKNRGKVFRLISLLCRYLCMRYSTALFACGEEAGEYLYGKKRMRVGLVEIVENAIDLESFSRNSEYRKDIRTKLNVMNKFVVGHVGRFTKQKNHERLIDIFNQLLKYRKDAVLLLVGTGELEGAIKKKTRDLLISDKVIFLGTTKNMNKIYNAMDIFVLPSLYEGFPVVSVEVQMTNLPSVFSDSIAPTCKITDAIQFVSLNNSDDEWAKAIIDVYNNFKLCDLTDIIKKYDIKRKVNELDNYYSMSLRLEGCGE